jgi:hypothetical protein
MPRSLPQATLSAPVCWARRAWCRGLFKGPWPALGTLAPERLSDLRRVATIESIGSSTRIEGNRLSDREVERERLLLACLPDLSIQLLEHARDHGRISLGEAETLTGANRNTLKLHFKALRERGLLVLHGQGRGAWYSLPSLDLQLTGLPFGDRGTSRCSAISGLQSADRLFNGRDECGGGMERGFTLVPRSGLQRVIGIGTQIFELAQGCPQNRGRTGHFERNGC